MAANDSIGIKGWQNYSSFSLFSSSSQRADRPHSLFINMYSGNVTLLATDVVLQARVTPTIARAYNSLDTTSDLPRAFGIGWSFNLDECLISNTGTPEDIESGDENVLHKDASGNEWEYDYDAQDSEYDTPRGLKTTLEWDSGNSWYELTSGKLTFRFELAEFDGQGNNPTMAILTRIEDKYGNALIVDRELDGNSKLTKKITDVEHRWYDTSSSQWTTSQIMDVRYVANKDVIETIRLDDTLDSGDFVYLYYEYDNDDMVEKVHWMEGTAATIQNNPGNGTNLNASVQYTYDGNNKLQYAYDSIACQAGVSADSNDSWKVSYSAGKASSVRYRNDNDDTGGNFTATTDYTYDVTQNLPFTKLSPNNQVTKVNDGESRDWWYEHEYDAQNTWKNGRIVRTADPLYDDNTNKNDVQYTWNSDHNLTEVKTWEPNAGASQISTKYYYNANANLEVVQDALGFLSFYKYHATKINYPIEVYTQEPNQNVTTTPPADPDIDDVLSDEDGYYYNDGSGTPQKIRLVKTTMTYTANDDLATVATPLGNTTTYNYDSTTGDMTWVKDPRQTADANLGRTDYAYDDEFGVVTSVTNALSQATSYEYDTAKVRQTKVILPRDNKCYTSYEYTRLWYLDKVIRPTPSTGQAPEVTVTEYIYDYNGNTTDVKLPDEWTENDQFTARQFVYDRLNRMTESKVRVDLQGGSGREWLSTKYGYDRVNNQLWVKAPDHYVTLTDYDNANRAVKVYETFRDTGNPSGTPPTYTVPQDTPYVEYDLDKLGNVKTLTDMRGNDTDYTYDDLSRAIQVDIDYTIPDAAPPTDTVTTKTVYDSAGLTYNTENGRGKKMYFDYDDDSRKVKNIRLIRATGDNDETEYDANGNVAKYYDFESVADSKSYYTEYKYDKLNRVVNVTDNEGNDFTADTEFDANGSLYKKYDRVNASGTYFHKYYYDYWDRVTKVEFPQVKDIGDLNVIYDEEYTYDLLGNRLTVQDKRNNSTSYEYDELGRVLLVQTPGQPSYSTVTRYLDRGFVDYVQHQSGAYTRFTYDSMGRPTRIRSDHDSGTLDDTDYTYDDNGNVTQIDYPDSGKTKNTYDELNRQIKQEVLRTAPNTYITTEYAYTKTHKILTISHPTGQGTSYTYDDLDNVTQLTAPGNHSTSYTYDKQNRTDTITDPDSLETEYDYNKNGWTTKVTNKVDATPANNVVVEYGYDDNGSRTSEMDPRGNTWAREYDAMNRNTKIAVAGVIPAITLGRWFDGNSNVVKVVDFKDVTTNYVYNERNLRSSLGWGAQSNDVTYTWGCCRVTAYTDATGNASLSYTELAQLTSFTDTQGNQVQYLYDSMGRVTRIRDHTPSNTDYTYDKRGGVTRVATPSGNTDYTHDTAGRVSTRTYANNIKTSYTYGNAGRVTQMKFEDVTNPGQPVLLDQYDYTYTGLNQQYIRTETTGAVEYRYQFDKLRRMTQERKRGTGQGNPLHYQKDFTYDKAGNRASYQHQNGGGQNYGMTVNYDSYSYDMMGRLTQIQDSGRSFTATITNDMNGNITEVTEVIPGVMNVTSTFGYDNENRLTAFTIGLAGFSAEHTYDGFNRLIKTDATVGVNTTNYEHTYDVKRHLGNIDVTNQEQPVNGKVWRWEGGAGTPSADPIECPQRSSQSGTQYYMLNDERTIEKRSYQVGGVVAGDTNDDSRYAEWQHVNGAPVPTRIGIGVHPSELFSAYNITLDADRASSAATNHALQLAATDLEYEVTRVKSPVLGRDMNPMGRGDGTYYCNGGNAAGGSVAIYAAKPQFIGERAYGYGSSVNNAWDLGERTERIKEICPLLLFYCPTIWPPPEGDPCEGLDTSDPWVLCCKCAPLVCPDCPDCSHITGCCIVKTPEWYAYCMNKPPENPDGPEKPPGETCRDACGNAGRMEVHCRDLLEMVGGDVAYSICLLNCEAQCLAKGFADDLRIDLVEYGVLEELMHDCCLEAKKRLVVPV